MPLQGYCLNVNIRTVPVRPYGRQQSNSSVLIVGHCVVCTVSTVFSGLKQRHEGCYLQYSY